MEKLVSVVVLVYKVEKYLDRCIDSIVKQTYSNLEIILVDDGSPDNCPQMCEDWAKRDSRIKVVHKANAGIGMARNTGIEHATGAYICFFDSDDFIEPDTIENAYIAAEQNNADLVYFGFNNIDSKGDKVSEQIPKTPKQVFSGAEVQETLLPMMITSDPKTGERWGLSLNAWSKFFSMRCIQKNNWRFVSEREIISEDYYSVAELFADVQTVCVLPLALYNYCQNDASASRAYRKDRFEKNCHFYSEIIKLCNRLSYSEDVKCRFARKFLIAALVALKHEAAFGGSFQSKRTAIRDILNNSELQRVLQERKKDKFDKKKKVLFWAMRHKMVIVCYLLLAAQNTVA